MMVEELQNGLDGHLDISVADLNFTAALQDIKAKLALPLEKRKKTPLGQYKLQIKSGTLKKLYFPLHVHENHWTAAELDFKKQTVSFGKSLYMFF
jgi:hypothetical protein